MVARFSVVYLALLLVAFASSDACGAHRYIYCGGGQPYYCQRPARYSDGYYVICDEPRVVRIDGYPVISSRQAETRVAGRDVSTYSSYSKTYAPTSNCDCGPSTPTYDCQNPPHVLGGCNCNAPGNVTPIVRPQGNLQVKCTKNTFYIAIGKIKGTIPVPQLCVESTDKYNFKSIRLKYPCKDASIANTDCKECKDINCADTCDVDACEVFQKSEQCNIKCIKCDREGQLLIAVRRKANPSDPWIADVYIGKVGQADFPEYPTNLVVLRERDQATIQQLLRNSSISLQAIVNANPGTTDLISQL